MGCGCGGWWGWCRCVRECGVVQDGLLGFRGVWSGWCGVEWAGVGLCGV